MSPRPALQTFLRRNMSGGWGGTSNIRTNSRNGTEASTNRSRMTSRLTLLLMEQGPQLPFPYSSGVSASRHSHMRELRVQSGGRPIRIFYAFDPRRSAILLIGGDKSGDKRFYDRLIPVADSLYDTYLKELRKEGLIP